MKLYPHHFIQLGLQDAILPVIELINFHDHTLIIISLISSLVLYIISPSKAFLQGLQPCLTMSDLTCSPQCSQTCILHEFQSSTKWMTLPSSTIKSRCSLTPLTHSRSQPYQLLCANPGKYFSKKFPLRSRETFQLRLFVLFCFFN